MTPLDRPTHQKHTTGNLPLTTPSRHSHHISPHSPLRDQHRRQTTLPARHGHNKSNRSQQRPCLILRRGMRRRESPKGAARRSRVKSSSMSVSGTGLDRAMVDHRQCVPSTGCDRGGSVWRGHLGSPPAIRHKGGDQEGCAVRSRHVRPPNSEGAETAEVLCRGGRERERECHDLQREYER